MELHLNDYTLHFIKKSTHLHLPKFPHYLRRRLRRQSPTRIATVRVSASAEALVATPEQPGGKMVVELVGAFNELTERMDNKVLSTSSSRLLFKALKLCIPILQSLPLAPDGRAPLSRALSVAVILADLQMDAEVISTGLLREVLEAGAISIYDVRDRIGTSTAHLLHESLRVKHMSLKVEVLDDDSATALRKFCLTYYDVRALVLDLAIKLDMMRHFDYLPRYRQQMISLEVMKLHAPLAHAIGTNLLSLELEDLSFRYLFPYSYLYLDAWLRSHESGNKPLIDICKEQLLQSLKSDPLLMQMVSKISVEGRYKSRYSTMKKLLRDGRKLDEVNDILGLRVVLTPLSAGVDEMEIGEKACYRAREVVLSLWKEIPSRSKDYILRPKANGYKSLHMAVDTSERDRTRPLMEIQIRTAEMDILAAGGTASHALYKGGVTDPEEAKHLKAIMMAAAEFAALRLKDLPSGNPKGLETDKRGRVFRLLDKNGDGKLSIDELMEVMEELGAPGDDAREMMQLLDSNSDGFLSSDEFDLFQDQIEFIRNIEDRDDQYQTLLNEKLQMANETGLIQVYSKEQGDTL
ncbi:PREDICTED: probable GTP diphosphokinase CRSH, chloroplastic [Nicotiana attenuata]|uniref:GTP diphosphokinase n=1 Tax=Nicotiana attenuata TaxID=49451 RepID=A0A1J6HVR4_NICAT|nr:PREDICTED: probable GTP diphosphokinase CRSH, chloroplastic [Nicotiana attenuata]OIS96419.1 putative gtp diphosphokinase crsh, chloroplastic [Nicotiana attenuata]